MGLFDFLRKPKNKPVQTRAQFAVDFDDERITVRPPNAAAQSLSWSDLRLVVIQTTDQGPAVDDIFWILVGAKDVYAVPSESVGAKELIERLQQLPEAAT